MHSIHDFERLIIITGHYGTGKTTLAVNLAIDLAKSGRKVTLADLDVVNPYFRTADFREVAEANGIELLASPYANSNLDLPALTGAFDAKIQGDGTLIMDVGGDDAGATALGRYALRIKEKPYTMLCVVNGYRYLTETPEDAAQMLKDIEMASRLDVTGLVNNSNLSYETGEAEIERSLAYAEAVAALTSKPVLLTSVKRDLFQKLDDKSEYYPVDIYVKAPWN